LVEKIVVDKTVDRACKGSGRDLFEGTSCRMKFEAVAMVKMPMLIFDALL
jgi:hypothetical protein